jgi:hypothetical protein
MKHYTRGFGPLIIVIVIAIAAAVGGGSYYSVKHKNEARMELKGDMQASSTSGARIKGNLRSLLSMGGNVMCTISQVTSAAKTSGTVYISGGNMRGDFTTEMTAYATGTITSHMLRKQDDVYVWSSAMSNQGIKIHMDEMMKADANAQTKGAIDLNADGEYSCSPWKTDEAKFTVPSTVTFVDIAAMMKGGVKAVVPNIPNINAGADLNINLQTR